MQRLFGESVSLVIWKWLQFTECHMQSERTAFKQGQLSGNCCYYCVRGSVFVIVLVEKGKIVASLHFDCSNYMSELSLLSQETKTNDDKTTENVLCTCPTVRGWGYINVNQYSHKESQANMPVCACFLTV